MSCIRMTTTTSVSESGSDPSPKGIQSEQGTSGSPPWPANEGAGALQDAIRNNMASASVLLHQGRGSDAIRGLLRQPAIGPIDPSVKASFLAAVMEALVAIRSTDVAALLSSLSMDERDVLMIYVYEGFAQPETCPSGVLLQWHEKMVESFGLGCISRALTFRRSW